ncbi:AraC-like ligand-binding domain-containing protein [Novosphingobium taihuense]|uniref:AraC-like DNA-binding protein n=1 Tax=Novosphingobium taihuense TaxID=260085 RepID=A0A7W7AET3_9SPHN|nr:helix-turn-helix domain-containing protein [Novosphingobium taihuense]MBB4614999.1 AraC-like DNA-binding protein [Novosphingobium taihuense]TWH84560.1 AraC-like DNA-binding protein [Novosphingobium taihuense]
MLEVLSTRELAPVERLDYWNDLIASTYTGMVVDAPRDRFDARLTVWQMGTLRMVRPYSRAAVISRHAERHTRPTDQALVAHLLTRGSARLEQRGRSVDLVEGDMVLCAAEEFYRFDTKATHEMMVVEFDRRTLAERVPGIDDFVARRISGQLPSTRLAHRYMSSLWQEASETLPGAHWQMHAGILGDIIASCIEGSREVAEAPGHALLSRAEAVIRERIGDAGLTPSAVAMEIGVPLRTLQAAAASAGTTPSALIMRRRLQRAAKRLLSEPGASVTSIALESGFADSAHFARRFQQHFGATPSHYRRMN